jgi:hypothetical protein
MQLWIRSFRPEMEYLEMEAHACRRPLFRLRTELYESFVEKLWVM